MVWVVVGVLIVRVVIVPIEFRSFVNCEVIFVPRLYDAMLRRLL